MGDLLLLIFFVFMAATISYSVIRHTRAEEKLPLFITILNNLKPRSYLWQSVFVIGVCVWLYYKAGLGKAVLLGVVWFLLLGINLFMQQKKPPN